MQHRSHIQCRQVSAPRHHQLCFFLHACPEGAPSKNLPLVGAPPITSLKRVHSQGAKAAMASCIAKCVSAPCSRSCSLKCRLGGSRPAAFVPTAENSHVVSANHVGFLVGALLVPVSTTMLQLRGAQRAQIHAVSKERKGVWQLGVQIAHPLRKGRLEHARDASSRYLPSAQQNVTIAKVCHRTGICFFILKN